MKSKIRSLIIIIIGMVLIIAGGITFVSKPSSTDNNDLEEPDVKEEPKELRKILEEEISNETAKEIIQFYLDKDSSNEKYKILNATILASNENGKYLVRLEIENDNDERDTSIQYLGDGKWQVELPLKYSGDYSDEYTIFWGVEE